MLTNEKLVNHIDDFLSIYPNKPISDNSGGMGLNHCFALYSILRELKPEVVVESGVWKGQSTWIIEQAVPMAEIYCLDPNPGVPQYTSERAKYYTGDFAGIDWSGANVENALCFFDDHQNAYSRLMEMKWWGFKRAIFEDNFPIGEGDCYTIKHVDSGIGHVEIQMSKDYMLKGKSWLIRKLEEKILRKYYWRQSMIRHPNLVDRAGLHKNLKCYLEVVPLMINPTNNWGGDWKNGYSVQAQPIFNNSNQSPLLKTFLEFKSSLEKNKELAYGYVCYVEIQ
jgi:hypothetical protein